jgi:long-chain acyl-CoA synthetase
MSQTLPDSAVSAEECLRATDALTLPGLLRRNAIEYADLPALSAGTETLSWAALREHAAAATRGIAELGLRHGERVMIMMSSRPEHWMADAAAVHLGAIPCTAYQTLSTEQIGFVARHSAATMAVLEGADEIARWLPVLDDLPALRTVVVIDAAACPADPRFVAWSGVLARGAELQGAEPAMFEDLADLVEPDDPIAMMYTSGTTGDPKAVVLSHRNAFYQAVAVDAVVPTPMHAKSVAYLPLAHIAERELGIYRAAFKALHVTVCADPAQVVAALGQTRPPAFFGVPRVWEKLAGGLRAKIDSLDVPARTAIMAAHALGVTALRLTGSGQRVPDDLAAQLAAADAVALRPIRAALGLDALQWASSGSAPIPVEVLEYLAGFGIRVLEVWGLSETTGCATVNTADAFRLGSVGRPLPGVDVRLADDGEIFVRGPIVFLGYLAADGSVQSAVDADGWLATGDVGTLDADGFLTIIDRKKELIITSSGKNIAPSHLEGMLRAHPLVGQAIAVGDRRPYVTALISLDAETAPAWAAAAGIDAADLAQLAGHPQVRAELDGLVASANGRLARVEQIKRFEVCARTWSPESGELTPTLKLRRRVVEQLYAEQIDALYAAD